ncbi:MAG: 3,4-dehydroadipyl-CoA semialdehyde dehydrogenase [Deltaproteobacteria bacterium]|nr:MAG: 3,4-dehydroadipyl-CoA semialdehyde dehydrogenase [Deltaproteobacteria bacterium]
MEKLASYLAGTWEEGTGPRFVLENPATETPLAEGRAVASAAPAFAWARNVGIENVTALGYRERAERLEALSKRMFEERERFLDLAVANGGNTRKDAKFDVDGASAVLAAYARIGADLPEGNVRPVDAAVPLLKTGKLRAQQVFVPRRGVAVQVNAFNFPAWGMVGKFAVAFLAGMPTIAKPATSTCLLAYHIARVFLESGLLPDGALQLYLGPAGDLLDHVDGQDVIAFTGSADTGRKIRTGARVLDAGTRVNVEADSLNAAVVAADVEPGTELYDTLLRDLVTEMTQKAGQKCTAFRRILVPEPLADRLQEDLVDRLGAVAERTGDPARDEVRMGPLSSAAQLRDARAGLARLSEATERVFGDPERTSFVGVPDGKGHFLEPILLRATSDAALDGAAPFHHCEVFGPVATLLPYDGTLEAAARIVALGGGSLQSSLYTNDRDLAARAIEHLGAYLGRMVIDDEKNAAGSIPPGGVLPLVHHGGPGRAGDGSELGGTTGLALYQQRLSLQAGASLLAKTVPGAAS